MRTLLLEAEGMWSQAKRAAGSYQELEEIFFFKKWIVMGYIVVGMYYRKCVFRNLLLCGHCRVYYTNQDGYASRR